LTQGKIKTNIWGPKEEQDGYLSRGISHPSGGVPRPSHGMMSFSSCGIAFRGCGIGFRRRGIKHQLGVMQIAAKVMVQSENLWYQKIALINALLMLTLRNIYLFLAEFCIDYAVYIVD
jgi:hypothetical protein